MEMNTALSLPLEQATYSFLWVRLAAIQRRAGAGVLLGCTSWLPPATHLSCRVAWGGCLGGWGNQGASKGVPPRPCGAMQWAGAWH